MVLRLLLDSHAVYWSLADPDQLEPTARNAIADPRNAVFVSAASVYELTFKVARGRLRLPADVVAASVDAGFEPLPLTPPQARSAGALPLHHSDPFDRLLIAQAQDEGLTIVTRDRAFQRYAVALLPA